MEKFGRILEKYVKLLGLRKKRRSHKMTTKGNNSKLRIIAFFDKNGRWPSRKSPYVNERKLGTRFENYITPTAGAYDSVLRRIVMASGRKSNFKSKHNIELNKKLLLEFIETHKRVPTTQIKFEEIPGESLLRRYLDYYTKDKNDMTLLGKIYSVDKCHLSGIPMKFRSIINSSLNVEKPLIRLVK